MLAAAVSVKLITEVPHAATYKVAATIHLVSEAKFSHFNPKHQRFLFCGDSWQRLKLRGLAIHEDGATETTQIGAVKLWLKPGPGAERSIISWDKSETHRLFSIHGLHPQLPVCLRESLECDGSSSVETHKDSISKKGKGKH